MPSHFKKVKHTLLFKAVTECSVQRTPRVELIFMLHFLTLLPLISEQNTVLLQSCAIKTICMLQRQNILVRSSIF